MDVTGLGYPAIIVKNMEESLEFYRRLGMEMLYVEPNRDDSDSVQALLAAGDEAFVMLIGPRDPNISLAEASLGAGSMQYLTLRIAADQMEQIFHHMSSAGVRGSEMIVRGYERLVFLEDPNGVLVLLMAWGTEPPAGMSRARVLQRAAAFREEARSPFIEDEHVRRAIAELQATS